MTESPRRLAELILARDGVWTDADAEAVASAYLEAHKVGTALYEALLGIFVEELNGRLCALPETLPEPWSDDPQVPRGSKCCPVCKRHWERTRAALKAYEAKAAA